MRSGRRGRRGGRWWALLLLLLEQVLLGCGIGSERQRHAAHRAPEVCLCLGVEMGSLARPVQRRLDGALLSLGARPCI